MADKEYITQAYLASLLGISSRRVQQLISEGVISKCETKNKKTIEAQKAIEEYYKYKFAPEETKALRDVQADHEVLKMELTQLKLETVKKNLHLAEDVENCMTNMILNFKNKLISLPPKISAQTIGMEDINEITEVIDLEIRNTLEELSEYNEEMFTGELNE